MLTVENQGGHGAIEVCLDDGQACTNTNRIAVAQGQCKTGVGSCTQTIETTKSEVADGLKIVWSALHTGPDQSYLATAYTCSPGSKGCTTGKTGHMAKLNANKTQIQTVIKFDANSDSATIGGTFSKDMPETAGGGVNYCYDGKALKVGNVRATGPTAAACQDGMNELAGSCPVGVSISVCGSQQHQALYSPGSGVCSGTFGDNDDGDFCVDY